MWGEALKPPTLSRVARGQRSPKVGMFSSHFVLSTPLLLLLLCPDDFLSYSCGIVKDYLNKDLSQEISRLYP